VVAEGGVNGGRDGGQERPAKPWADKTTVVVQMQSAWQRRCSDRVADGLAHTVLYFPELSKSVQIWKLKMDALPWTKNFQFLHGSKLGHVNHFLHCADIHFSIELELKILEQIQHFNL
jgi:hypothetical protein